MRFTNTINWLSKDENNVAIDKEGFLYTMHGNVLKWRSACHNFSWERCDCPVSVLITARFAKYE